ncbi:MAG TPA: VCBS repeat-containing protein [Thermoanaerobaculia bacterium]|nr:VCBS repeat-containing protein [Thermoanaerobaculia bacterium]
MKRSLTSSLLLAAVLAAPPPATHVVAVSGEVILTTALDTPSQINAPDVTAGAVGEFVVAWSADYTIYGGSQPIGFMGGIHGRKVGLHAQPLGPGLDIVPFGNALDVENPRIAGNRAGRFVVAWELTDANFTSNRSRFFLRTRPFGADAKPLGGEVKLYSSAVGNAGQMLLPAPYEAVGMDPTGRSIVTWLQPLPLAGNPEEGFGTLQAQLFDATGKAASGRFAVTGRQQAEAAPAAAMDGRGNALVVYETHTGIALRRYDPRGRPLGGEVEVVGSGGGRNPRVAASAEGRFLVVWSDLEKILGQPFDPAGQPVGSVQQLSESAAVSRFPALAMDSRGNFAVAWEGLDSVGFPVHFARLFSREGVPQSADLAVSEQPLGDFGGLDYASAPSVALGENSTFLVTWRITQEGTFETLARSFRALSNRDRCVYRGSTFLCGAAGGSLTPLVQLGNGTAAGDRPFLADLDGDGADDPCVRHAGTYLCALSGSGYAVATIPFGAAAHVPLLGDVDGDGIADPCVRRGRFFLCDTAHDGGGAELKVAFGLASDLPLLGDVDGDGKADLCVFRDGQLFCDTHRDGTTGLVLAENVQPGDVPLLGDADGDGRADFCVVRGTQLLCDLDRSGVLTAQPLTIQPGDVVLLGKVDRL